MSKHNERFSLSPAVNVREKEYVRRRVEPVNRSQVVCRLKKLYINNDDITTGSLEMRAIKLLSKGGNCGSLS